MLPTHQEIPFLNHTKLVQTMLKILTMGITQSQYSFYQEYSKNEYGLSINIGISITISKMAIDILRRLGFTSCFLHAIYLSQLT